MAGIRTSSEVVKKAPNEKLLVTVDFSANMETGETVDTVNDVSVSPSGPTFSSIAASGQTAQFYVEGGTADTVYLVTTRVTTSASGGGQILVNVGKLRVDGA